MPRSLRRPGCPSHTFGDRSVPSKAGATGCRGLRVASRWRRSSHGDGVRVGPALVGGGASGRSPSIVVRLGDRTGTRGAGPRGRGWIAGSGTGVDGRISWGGRGSVLSGEGVGNVRRRRN